MPERQQQPSPSAGEPPRSAPPPPPAIKILPEHTQPLGAAKAVHEEEPLILGLPAEYVADTGAQPVAHAAAAHVVVLRRADPVGGLALVLAGTAAGVSLGLPWFRGAGATGLSLFQQGVVIVPSGPGQVGRSGLWQPLVVVLGGGVLLLLGLLLFRNARTHRVVGVAALLVALAAAAGVVVPLADANWSARSFGPGMWCAVVVALLGVLGALKAMLTAAAVTAEPD
jgi:hypothetical protein